MILINGLKQSQISVFDRAFQYGDGCFTTLPCIAGRLQLWPRHLARLQDDCARLDIHFSLWDELSISVHQLVDTLACQQDKAVIKIIITRGQGGRGYSPQGVSGANYIISSHDFPQHYHLWQKEGIDLTTSTIMLGKQPLLAGIKHLNRLEQVFVKQQLDMTCFHDALVCDSDKAIVESSAGNVFWFNDGKWYTPYLDYCGVEGVMRNYILAIMKAQSLPVFEVRHPLDNHFVAQEMFICNSLMTVVPINSLNSINGTQSWLFSSEQVKLLQSVLKDKLLNE